MRFFRSRRTRGLACALCALAAAAPAAAAVSVSYTYDALGRVATAAYSDGMTITYTYDAAGNRTQKATTSIPPPSAVNDSITTSQNHAKTFDPRTNDTGSGITITAKTDGSHGTVAINSGTSLTYTPTTGYTGSDSFTYTITNGYGSSVGTVNVTVSPPTVLLLVDSYGTIYLPPTGWNYNSGILTAFWTMSGKTGGAICWGPLATMDPSFSSTPSCTAGDDFAVNLYGSDWYLTIY